MISCTPVNLRAFSADLVTNYWRQLSQVRRYISPLTVLWSLAANLKVLAKRTMTSTMRYKRSIHERRWKIWRTADKRWGLNRRQTVSLLLQLALDKKTRGQWAADHDSSDYWTRIAITTTAAQTAAVVAIGTTGLPNYQSFCGCGERCWWQPRWHVVISTMRPGSWCLVKFKCSSYIVCSLPVTRRSFAVRVGQHVKPKRFWHDRLNRGGPPLSLSQYLSCDSRRQLWYQIECAWSTLFRVYCMAVLTSAGLTLVLLLRVAVADVCSLPGDLANERRISHGCITCRDQHTLFVKPSRAASTRRRWSVCQ